MSIKPCFLNCLYEFHQIILSFKIVLKIELHAQISEEQSLENRAKNREFGRESEVHCQEKAREHSRRHRFQLHQDPLLWLSESDLPTSAHREIIVLKN